MYTTERRAKMQMVQSMTLENYDNLIYALKQYARQASPPNKKQKVIFHNWIVCMEYSVGVALHANPMASLRKGDK